MRKRARTVLCGGRSAMVVPTASTESGERLANGLRLSGPLARLGSS
jgi:hypothetical protein